MRRVALGAVCAVVMVATTLVAAPVGAAGTGSINGTVTADVTGIPLSGIEVCAFSPMAGACTFSAFNGAYTLPALEPGTFEVRFTDTTGNFVAESYDDIQDFSNSTPVEVLDGVATTGIDAALATAGFVAGTVTEEGGTPIAGLFVCANGPNFGCGSTAPDGSYSIGGLQAGSFTVHFDTGGTPFVEEYFDDASDMADADPVVVSAGSTSTGVDAQLAIGTTITGTVTDGANPLNALVCAEAAGTSRCDITDVSGNYTISGLADGSYVVSFSDFDALYGFEFYDDAVDIGNATPVATSVANPAAGIDAVLELLTSISGTVTDGANPLPNIQVCADDGLSSVCSSTDGSGQYTIGGVRPGDHVVSFLDFSGTYEDEYFDNASDFGSATPVTATSAAPVIGIDAVLEQGASISGTVTGQANPLAGIRVCAFSDLDGSCTLTDGFGDYTVGGLEDGNYVVSFEDDSQVYVNEYYDDQIGFSDAVLVPTTSASPAIGIDADLAMGSAISGVVTDEDGAPLSVTVCASGNPGPLSPCTTSAIDGTWTVGGLVDGTYTIRYDDFQNMYVGEYHDDALSYLDATNVVIAGSDVVGLMAELTLGGRVAGTVTDATGAPLAGILVCAEPIGGSDTGSYCSTTDTDGTYGEFMPGTPDGDFVVQAIDFNGIYRSEFHGGALQRDFADPVTVVSPNQTSDIDIELDSLADLGDAFHLLPFGCQPLFSGPLASGNVATTNMEFCGVPDDATAAQVVVTAHDPQAFGNLRISPSGVAPLGGIVNFAANGLANSNSAAVPLGANGELDVSANSSSNGTLVNAAEVQVLGWYGPDNGLGLEYVPITPCAFVDTRSDATPPAGDFVGPLSPFEMVNASLSGTVPASQGVASVDCGVPDDATAALVNFVLIGATDDVSLNNPASFASIVNNTALTPPMNNSAAVPVPIGADGMVAVDVAGSGDTHVRAVVLGYYRPNTVDGLEHHSLTPCAAFDTRTGTGAFGGKRDGGETTTFDVAGTFASAQGGGNSDCGVPSDAVAVEINLVAIAPNRFGNLRASAAGVAPTGGVLNFGALSPAMNNSNTVVIPVAGGEIDVNVNAGAGGVGQETVHVRGVITGYYSAATPPA